MKIVYVNLHLNGTFVQMLAQILRRQHAIKKQKFILDYLFANHIEVCNLLTLNGTKLPEFIRAHTQSYKFRKMEANYVFKKNGITPEQVRLITDLKEIADDDIVIYHTALAKWSLDGAENVPGIKVIDMIHLYGESDIANMMRDKGFQYYMFDVDLRKYSKMFQKNYSWFEGGYIERPYAFEKRFCVKKAFPERKTKAVAMGTTIARRTPEFISINGNEFYQPHRKMICDNASNYPEELDSYIGSFYKKPLKVVQDTDPKLVKVMKQIANLFKDGRQKEYFSFDMVDKYNEYKMFICPEDVHGSYGIGTIEGMACGCAMIGYSYGAFEDMGMTAGVHYIAYDGTMEGLIAKIRYYQRPENQAELEQIARTGCEFVRARFNEETVAKRYYDTLKSISEKYRAVHPAGRYAQP